MDLTDLITDTRIICLMKFNVRHVPTFYSSALLSGTLFFIPAIFVNRFTTASALGVQVGISIGIIRFVLIGRKKVRPTITPPGQDCLLDPRTPRALLPT